MMKLRPPSPALIVAMVAMLVALSGTAVAAGVVPLAKRALYANNAGKLQGKTPGQIAAMPGPTKTVKSLVSTSSAPFSLDPQGEGEITIPCAGGAKAISGGYATSNVVISADTHPTANGAGWTLYLVNLSSTEAASGSAQAICLK
ncbi:MAG TPA: hypothetical protein VHI55_04575 [Gaiellaceae bacterium]|jgi:hypothetical protein|nr:hypothetical protein [Gaiellaceae bacterium]